MINSDAIQDLIESLQRVFGSPSSGPSESDADENEKSEKELPNKKEKKITIVSIGAAPKQGLKIPKQKKGKDDDGVK